VSKHRALHQRLQSAREWIERLPFNEVFGSGERGILAAGYAFRKLLDSLGTESRDDLRVLKLSALYPLPEELVARFLSDCRDVLVLEENEPFIESSIKAIAHDHELDVRIFGKLSGHVPREGELFRWQIQRALDRYLPAFAPRHFYLDQDEAHERPKRENYCAGCHYAPILDALQAAAAALDEELVLVADPGCLVSVADRIDAKYAIGSAVGVADGLAKAGFRGRAVALYGDSSFFHTTLPAICNAAVNGSDILMIVLDNGATVTSGFQPNPGVGRDARGRPAPKLNIEAIARACGVTYVRGIGPEDLEPRLGAFFRAALAHRGLGLVVVRTTCGGT
jgi:indolepyruvate ferredoxin oxidoreductase alpha subunit